MGEKERFRIKVLQIDILRSLLGIKRIYKLVLCCKWMDENVLLWFSHIERMEHIKIAKRVYKGSLWEAVQWVDSENVD